MIKGIPGTPNSGVKGFSYNKAVTYNEGTAPQAIMPPMPYITPDPPKVDPLAEFKKPSVVF